MPHVELADIIEAIDRPEEWQAFVDRRTGRVISMSDDHAERVFGADDEPGDFGEWEEEAIAELRRDVKGADLVPLPTLYDFYEWDVMRRFADSQPEPIRTRLFEAINQKGAFRLFKRAIDETGVRDAWFSVRDEALRRFAIQWLDEEGLAFGS